MPSYHYFVKKINKKNLFTQNAYFTRILNKLSTLGFKTGGSGTEIMQKNNIGCLPVVKNDKLIGIVTEHDFVRITDRL
jgi:hypothetical protein